MPRKVRMSAGLWPYFFGVPLLF